MTERRIDPNKNQTRANEPYDMALVVTFGDKDKNGKAKTASATTSVKKGIDAGDAVSALSGASVRLLMDLAGEKKKKQAKILAAYMERFMDAAVTLAGMDVMAIVAKRLTGE